MDFGCGDGRLSIPLSKLGYDVISVDSSIEMLKRLRTNMKIHNAYDIRGIVNSDGTNLKETLGRQGFLEVDAVVARAVFIHHDYEGVTKLVHSIASVLKPGGFLIADWPTSSQPKERRDWIDVTTWSPIERAKVADDAGFDLVSAETPSVWIKA